ncbi:MAG: hypothetical protein AAF609_00620 [Cyanobacteria bacterium P01_C01_bin.120]
MTAKAILGWANKGNDFVLFQSTASSQIAVNSDRQQPVTVESCRL